MREWWSHIPEGIDPYIIEVGSFRVGYYGLMYIVAFSLLYILVMWRLRRERLGYTKELVQDYFVWGILGLLAGARLGYVLFYNLGYYLSHPLEIILPFDVSDGFRYTGIAGMSYHGGMIGLLAASVAFCIKRRIDFWRFADLFAPAVPLGYTFGRLGNFINGELYGRPSEVPWAMYFPTDPEHMLRHPSQLYEAFFEGIVLFAVLWSLRKRSPFDGFIFSLYLIGYGVVRFAMEFFRAPDPQLGFVLGPLTMGQVLSLAMAAAGAGVGVYCSRRGAGGKARKGRQ
ncbi:MAG: prolipoprotein diacylglyceryl transferase [Thermodesulfovibrionales bacterium]